MTLSYIKFFLAALFMLGMVVLAHSEDETKRPCEDKAVLISLWQKAPEIIFIGERTHRERNHLVIVAMDGSAAVMPEQLDGSYCVGYNMMSRDIEDFFEEYPIEKGA